MFGKFATVGYDIEVGACNATTTLDAGSRFARRLMLEMPGEKWFVPEKVIFNDPATVVYWKDGTKTVVRCHEGDEFDKRTGFLLCCAKRLMGNTGKFNDAMLEHCGASDD